MPFLKTVHGKLNVKSSVCKHSLSHNYPEFLSLHFNPQLHLSESYWGEIAVHLLIDFYYIMNDS